MVFVDCGGLLLPILAWVDTDADGVQDAGEPGLAGVRIALWDGGTDWGGVTGKDGLLTGNLGPRSCSAQIDAASVGIPAGFRATTPTRINGARDSYSFGFAPLEALGR
jgi:hypothetical protein